jgi:hypothetical protein
MQRNLIKALEVTAMVVYCAFMLGCARNPQTKDSEGPHGEENITTRKSMKTDNPSDNEDTFPEEVGTFELIEVKSLDEFRKIYLPEDALDLGHDDHWQYVGSKYSDTVHKISRKILDQQTWRNIQAERSKMVYAPPGGPPFNRKRSKEFLDWLEKTKRSKD